ncbi:MAG: fatty acid--CoA ligase family protein [Terracidiphilus sp.]
MAGSILEGHGEELQGKAVLVATTDQLSAALVLLELEGVARRVVLYPPDLPLGHLSGVIESSGVEIIVSDRDDFQVGSRGIRHVSARLEKLAPRNNHPSRRVETEWVLLTSGTLGVPKLVVHNIASLTGAIRRGSGDGVVWSTFYDIRRFGGLQILLRAVLTGASLVLSDGSEVTADFLARAGQYGVTHISGTPSHWRRALMSSAAQLIDPKYVRLSGEIADETILCRLRSTYPNAKIAHAFATTEAGVAFEVNDGASGVPPEVIAGNSDVEMKVADRTLRIRSERTAIRYLGDNAPTLKDSEGFVDTGDILELREGRYYFAGRRDGRINVGGQKVHPEEVEAVINRHPNVEMSLVRTKKSPITGAVVVAEVVLRTCAISQDRDASALQGDILQLCRKELSSHKVPAAIYFVPSLTVGESGKMMRGHA